MGNEDNATMFQSKRTSKRKPTDKSHGFRVSNNKPANTYVHTPGN